MRWLAALLVVTTVSGCAIGTSLHLQHTPDHPAALAAPAPSPVARPVDLQPLQQQLNDYLAEQAGTWGLYVTDLASGKSLGIDADHPFLAASTFKLPLAMYALHQVHTGAATLDEQLTYTESDYEDGSGVLQNGPFGGSYSLKRVLELAIENSDNCAANMLLRRFPREQVWSYLRTLGITTVQGDSGANVITPHEMDQLLRDLGAGNDLDPAQRDLLLSFLQNTDWQDERIGGNLPPGAHAAHKIGTLPGVVNDVGIVYLPGSTFLISAFSEDVTEEAGAAVIADLTRLVAQYELGPT